MATHSSILAWEIIHMIIWTEEPGKLKSIGRKELGTTERLTLYFIYKKDKQRPTV